MTRMWVWLKLNVHEGMNHISNVKVHLKTRSGNVNIYYISHADRDMAVHDVMLK